MDVGNKSTCVLQALGEAPDPQIALKLLRSCASFCKLLYSIRVVPSHVHAQALHGFDAQVRACFEQFTCLHPEGDHWTQATLPTSSGGLGLRSVAQHSNAAFLASRTSCYELCRELDPAHTLQSTDGSVPAPERVAAESYNNCVNDDDKIAANSASKLS